jgi:multisubunit Na+/H+ antiporter MnhB subunit
LLELQIVGRILGMADLGLLAVATIASAAVVCLAAYIRAHKEEPLMTSSLVIGCATAASAALAAQLGETYVALAYAGVTILINFPWRYAIYRTYRGRIAIIPD